MELTISYEISYEAVKKEFIENGVYYSDSNYGRWLELSFDPSELSSEDRELIWSNCKDNGDGTFTYDSAYINVVCKSINEFLDCLKE